MGTTVPKALQGAFIALSGHCMSEGYMTHKFSHPLCYPGSPDPSELLSPTDYGQQPLRPLGSAMGGEEWGISKQDRQLHGLCSLHWRSCG